MNFRDRVSKNLQISNFMKIRPVGTELFHADRHDEANRRLSQFSNALRIHKNATYAVTCAESVRRFLATADIRATCWRDAVCTDSKQPAEEIPRKQRRKHKLVSLDCLITTDMRIWHNFSSLYLALKSGPKTRGISNFLNGFAAGKLPSCEMCIQCNNYARSLIFVELHRKK
jgi:hypothetical protein